MHPGDGLGIQQPRGPYGKATGDQGNLPICSAHELNPPAMRHRARAPLCPNRATAATAMAWKVLSTRAAFYTWPETPQPSARGAPSMTTAPIDKLIDVMARLRDPEGGCP